MTWAEFQIRLSAYKRQDYYEWTKLRELMWTIYIAPHQDPKKMIKRKEKFLPLNNEKVSSGISDEMKKVFLKEVAKYNNIVESKNSL